MNTKKMICTIACAMMIMMTACGNAKVQDVKNAGNSSIAEAVMGDENEVVTDAMDASSACEDDSSRTDESSSSRPDDSSKTDSSSKSENSSKKDNSSKAASKKSDSSKSESKTTTTTQKINSSGGNGNTATSQMTNSGSGNNGNSGNSNNNGNTGNSNNTQPVQNNTQPVENHDSEPVTTPPSQTVSEPAPVQLTEDGYDPREYAKLRGGALVHTNKPYDGFADDIHYYLSWVNDLSDVELAYFNFEMGCMSDRDWKMICDDCWNHIHNKYGYLSNIKIEDNSDYYVSFDENGNCLGWKGNFGFGISGASFYVNDKGDACVDEHNIDWYYEDFAVRIDHFYEEIDDVIDSYHFNEDDAFTLYIHLNYYFHGPSNAYVFICQG